MKKALITVIIICAFSLVLTDCLKLEAAELEEMWEAIQKNSLASLDFKVTITDNIGNELSDLALDEIITFNITSDEADNKIYTLLYAEDNQPIRLYEDITLPFILKQNFKGRKEGNYTITFGLKDALENIGKLSLTLTVKHKD